MKWPKICVLFKCLFCFNKFISDLHFRWKCLKLHWLYCGSQMLHVFTNWKFVATLHGASLSCHVPKRLSSFPVSGSHLGNSQDHFKLFHYCYIWFLFCFKFLIEGWLPCVGCAVFWYTTESAISIHRSLPSYVSLQPPRPHPSRSSQSTKPSSLC